MKWFLMVSQMTIQNQMLSTKILIIILSVMISQNNPLIISETSGSWPGEGMPAAVLEGDNNENQGEILQDGWRNGIKNHVLRQSIETLRYLWYHRRLFL